MTEQSTNLRMKPRGWTPALGDRVEIRRWGRKLRSGTVEAILPDGSGFWLAALGVDHRIFVHHDFADLEIWAR
jgi:hypothetical protein